MKKLKNMKKDINLGLPAIGKVLDDVSNDLPDKFERFFNSAAEGFEKFFTS